MMMINPEIFWSVLAALCVYGLGKHLLNVGLSQLLGGKAKSAVNHPVGAASQGRSSPTH